MKNWLVFITPTLIIFSCQESEKSKVEKIATEYLTFAKMKDYEKLEPFWTEETKQNMEILRCHSPWGTVKDAKDISCEVSGNKARCKFCCADDPYNNVLRFVKVDGRWLVNHPEETPEIDAVTALAFSH